MIYEDKDHDNNELQYDMSLDRFFRKKGKIRRKSGRKTEEEGRIAKMKQNIQQLRKRYRKQQKTKGENYRYTGSKKSGEK